MNMKQQIYISQLHFQNNLHKKNTEQIQNIKISGNSLYYAKGKFLESTLLLAKKMKVNIDTHVHFLISKNSTKLERNSIHF